MWGKYEQDVIAFESEFHLLSIGWKFLGDKRAQALGLCDFDRYADDPEDDYELAVWAHHLFNEADIVVAHNGVKFDTKKAQARMIAHNLEPPLPFKEVDTLQIARRHFAFNGNSLNDLCKTLNIGRKKETGGFNTWLGCMRGDPKAWDTMKRYNRHDVELLEQVYLRFRPWTDRHPNIATIVGAPDTCPRCAAVGSLEFAKYRYLSVGRRKVFRCLKCRGYCSAREIEKTDVTHV